MNYLFTFEKLFSTVNHQINKHKLLNLPKCPLYENVSGIIFNFIY